MPTLIGGRRYVTAGGTVGTLSLDGSASIVTIANQSSFNFSLTTTKTNDVIVAVVMGNGNAISGISSANTTSWAGRVSSPGASSIAAWYGVAAGTLSGESIGVTMSGAANCSGICFAVNGCDISSPATSFVDAGGPWNSNTGTPSGTTTKNVDFILAALRGNGDGASPGAPWVDLMGASRSSTFFSLSYWITSSTQSFSDGDTMTGVNGWVADALKASGQ